MPDCPESTVLVIGGARIIVNHLADELVDRSVDLVLMDDFSQGSLAHIAQREEDATLKLVDLISHEELARAVESH